MARQPKAHTFRGRFNPGTDKVDWAPRPHDEPDILVGDTLIFIGVGGSVFLDFTKTKKTPFRPNQPPAPPFVYEPSAGQDLIMTVVGPPNDDYPFDCAIRQPDGTLAGLGPGKGDDIPVGPRGG